MADLKLGTQIGGNLVWHQGILELNPVDDKLFYRDQEIMTTRGYQTMLGSIKFGTPNDVYDIESMSDGPGNVKRYLRKMRSGASSTIWHETINDRFYAISTGVTDTAPQFTLYNGDSATFQYPVYTNSPQSGLANAFTRRDYVIAEDAKKVNKAGDGMTGNLDFNLDNQGIRVKFPGGSVSNNSGVFGGKGDAAQKDKTNININSWYGVGFSPTVGVGSGTTKVVADGENSIWFNLRSGNMYTMGRLFVGEDQQVYSPLNKPTPGDLDAYTKKEVDEKSWFRVKDERAEMIAPNALQSKTISAYFTNKSDVSTSWVSGFVVNGWESAYAAWSLFSSARSDTDDKRLWFKRGRSEWLPSSRIYHEDDKPTNVELNLVSRAGDVMTGLLNMKVADTMGLGKYSIQLNNGSIGGINQLVFNDPSDTVSEGILFPKTGNSSANTVITDYDNLWALDGKLLFNNKEAYGEWNKPSADDTQSFPDVRTKLAVDLDTVLTIGAYFQDANTNATVAFHYPMQSAGSLLVTRSAYGVQQEYTTFGGRKFQRGRTGTNVWGPWTEFYSDAAPTRYLKTTGDTVTGTLKSTANIVIESTYDGMLTLNSTDDGPNYITFARSGDSRFFIRQTTTGDIATDHLDFLSGVKNESGSYLTPLWIDSKGVYTNLDQSDATNSLTRKDYVDTKVGTAVQSVTATGAVKSTGGINPVISLTNATTSADGAMSSADKAKLNGLPSAAVNKTGDTMTGSLSFSNDSSIVWARNTDRASIGFKNDSNSDVDSYMHFTVGDDDNEYFKFRTQASSKPVVDLINIKKENTTFMHDVVLAKRESNELTLTNDQTSYTNNTGTIRMIGGVYSQWYTDALIFGHFRGTSTASNGFGVKLNDKFLMQLTPDRSLTSGALIGDSYVAVQKQGKILAMEVDTTTKIPYISVDGTYQAIRFEANKDISMPAGGLNVGLNVNAEGDVFAKTNVNVTGQLIVFGDKATGKTASETGITTARMIEMLTAMGAFKTVYWCGKVNWDYAGSNVLTDTGYGNIHLAGCIVEVIGTAQYMIRITTPSTTGTALPNAQNNASSQFIYVNHGATYAPGWRRQINDHEVNNDANQTKAGILGKIPFVGKDGVMEVGQYIDFHHNSIADEDFTTRLMVGGSKQLQVVSTFGTIELGAQNTSFAHIYTDRPSFYFNKGLTALGSVNFTGNLNLNNGAPTITLQDTDGMGAFLHNNSNLFYVLRSPSANNASFDSGPNGIHPMTLNLENGDVQFSRNGSFNDVQIRSDIRLKSNLIDITGALDKVCSLTGKTFDKFGCDKREAGIIAQDLLKVLPEAVGSFKNTAGDEYLTVSNSGVNALLVEAIKELRAELNELKSKLN